MNPPPALVSPAASPAASPVRLAPVALILVVEDELELAEVLEGYLRREQYRTERASDGEKALALFWASKPDLVLLDIQMPKLDGLEVLRSIRSHAETPVILLTARAEDLDKLLGFGLGADDYITKPFSPREVLARVKAVLKRAQNTVPKVLRVGDLTIDAERIIASVNDVRIDLTPTEFRLLEHLARHSGRAFSRSELLSAILPASEALERVVDAHCKNLRRKLDEAGVGELLETVRGVGYRLWKS
jgi:two-component system, OmpR family, response regulator AdeR